MKYINCLLFVLQEFDQHMNSSGHKGRMQDILTMHSQATDGNTENR